MKSNTEPNSVYCWY